MSFGTDPRRFGPSSFTREQSREWSRWLKDPKGADQKGTSCTGPTSFGRAPDDIDELYERMVARGLVTGG